MDPWQRSGPNLHYRVHFTTKDEDDEEGEEEESVVAVPYPAAEMEMTIRAVGLLQFNNIHFPYTTHGRLAFTNFSQLNIIDHATHDISRTGR